MADGAYRMPLAAGSDVGGPASAPGRGPGLGVSGGDGGLLGMWCLLFRVLVIFAYICTLLSVCGLFSCGDALVMIWKRGVEHGLGQSQGKGGEGLSSGVGDDLYVSGEPHGPVLSRCCKKSGGRPLTAGLPDVQAEECACVRAVLTNRSLTVTWR